MSEVDVVLFARSATAVPLIDILLLIVVFPAKVLFPVPLSARLE